MSNIGAFNFTIEDVRKQLNILGYSSIPNDKLSEFAEDLRKLIEYDQKRVNNESFGSRSQSDTSVIQAVSDDNGGRNSVPASGTAITQPRSRKINGMKRILASRKSPVGMNSSLDETNISDLESSGLNNNFDELHLYQRGLSAVSECRRPASYYKPPSSARPDLYPQRPLHEENKSYAPHLPRSFIRPSTVTTSNNNNRGLPKSSSRKVDINGMTQEKRTDPVKKFNAYSEAWKQAKPPGEKNRNQLRWKIREQMAVSEEITKRRPSAKPSNNEYVVPTEKKRQDLRWEVRCNLAAFKPGSKNTQFY